MPKGIIRFLITGMTLFCGLILCVSCGKDLSQKRFSDIESILDSRPDSALILLRQVDTTALRGRAAKASFALLHAAALDKNYIDTADTRVVQPAVDWYDRHGTPEQRLKAWMYFGIEQFNGEKYNEAIVSFYRASVNADEIRDKNVLGILYSIMADTFTKTQEHAIASEYIERSLNCFKVCGRKDQEDKERVRKALNLIQLRRWDDARTTFRDLVSDTTISPDFRRKINADYSLFLLSSPFQDDTLAYSLMTESLSERVPLSGRTYYFAYAYLLSKMGKHKEAEDIWSKINCLTEQDEYAYHYWRHRDALSNKDYKKAYHALWSATQVRDTITREAYARSAANSQRAFLESFSRERALTLRNRNNIIVIVFLLLLTVVLAASNILVLYKKRIRSLEVEKERQDTAVKLLRSEMSKMENRLDNESLDKTRAKFSFLADIYEEFYLPYGGSPDDDSRLNNIIRSRIGDLRTSQAARKSLEGLVDKEMGGIMAKFRQDFPNLSEKEYNMACLVFAGFDNTVATVIMNVSSGDNFRKMKSRLKAKIIDSESRYKEDYLRLF